MYTDFILSLGPACRPAWHLKLNQLRYVSCPFDWMMSYRLETVIKFLKQKNLNGFFEKYEYMNRDSGNCKVVKDTTNQIISMHSFPVSMNIADFYPKFIQIMNKRFERLINILNDSKHITFLSNRNDINEIKKFLLDFNELYKDKIIVCINIEHSPELQDFYKSNIESIKDNISIHHVYFNDVHINGETKDNPKFWLGNEEKWKIICSTLHLKSPQNIVALNEDKELR